MRNGRDALRLQPGHELLRELLRADLVAGALHHPRPNLPASGSESAGTKRRKPAALSKKHGAAVREASGLKSPHRLATRSILEPAQPAQQVDRLLKRAAEEQPALEERNGLRLAEHCLVDVERVEQLVRVLLDQVVLCARARTESAQMLQKLEPWYTQAPWG